MENLVWAIILWGAVFILIPVKRIKQLLPAAAVTFVWFFTVNYLFIGLGYYRFTHILISFLDVPLIQAVGGAGGGILLVNWLTPSPLSKLGMLLAASSFFSLSEYVFRLFGAFLYGHGFSPLLSFIHNLAMISILIWLCLEAVGKENIYNGPKTRFFSSIYLNK